ncbi:unnamed protein product [Prorocentrum cordatum]|uniref:HMA domain-containing protein n=1 Tax=Prorocentrum cordatum TaxID=2364126 RepID=A0ABN9P9C9_9DINO|nr:unnamed protein product [Polarella glacialis]
MSPFFQWAWSRLVDDDSEFDEDAVARDTEEKDGHDGASVPSKRKARNRKTVGVTSTLIYVDGLCCPSEVPVIDRILSPLAGVQEVGINPATKTATVRHDARVVGGTELVAALNRAALGARVQKLERGAPVKRIPARLLAAAALLAVSVAGYLLNSWSVHRVSAVLSLLLTSPKVLVRAASGVTRCHLDINTLVLMACLGALALENFCEAATVLVLFSTADFLESRITLRARGVIAEILALRPEEAELSSGERVAASDLAVGASVVVRQGDSIPVDGVVTAGALLVDESALSGESAPVPKAVGSKVWAGTTNLSGYAEVETTAQGKDSAVGQLVKMVEGAQALRSNTEQTVERFARLYTPCILTVAFFLMIAPWFVARERAPECFYMTLVLLVVACPCAMVISTPVTYMSGIACAATHNMLVRGGVHLETLGAVRMAALDKTGTLTEGCFRVREFQMVSPDAAGKGEDILWRWIAAIEARSSHPLALALVTEAKRRDAAQLPTDVADYREVHGEGVRATVEGVCVSIGNERLAARMGWSTELHVDRWAEEGGSVLWVGDDQRLLAVLSVADVPRPEAKDAIAEIKSMGIAVSMLTGDGRGAAKAVGESTGIVDIRSGLRPDDKIAEVLDLCKSYQTVSMVGDGINDVPALAASHVGVAMGAAGRAAALEAADIVLMDSNLMRLAFAFRLGRCVLRKVRQNIAFALASKVVFVAFTFLGHTSLLGAILVDLGSMLLVMLNGSSVMLMGRERQRTGVHAEASLVASSAKAPEATTPPPRPQGAAPWAGGPGAVPPVPQAVCTDPRCCPVAQGPLLAGLGGAAPAPPPAAGGAFCAAFGGAPRGRRGRGRPLPRALGRPAAAAPAGEGGDLEKGV